MEFIWHLLVGLGAPNSNVHQASTMALLKCCIFCLENSWFSRIFYHFIWFGCYPCGARPIERWTFFRVRFRWLGDIQAWLRNYNQTVGTIVATKGTELSHAFGLGCLVQKVADLLATRQRTDGIYFVITPRVFGFTSCSHNWGPALCKSTFSHGYWITQKKQVW